MCEGFIVLLLSISLLEIIRRGLARGKKQLLLLKMVLEYLAVSGINYTGEDLQ